MEITLDTVRRIAQLAKLDLSESEATKMQEDLSRILDWMDILNELNTNEVEPLVHISDEVDVLREDEVAHTLSREKGLENAPKTDGEFFQVPKVINY
jgi:aspartyl-tRNA(Asn)/glutamyl-tRNA(Gln) amidotransferase subunit C